jgi:uncharacterized membrane protein YcaP (DUF421 family)
MHPVFADLGDVVDRVLGLQTTELTFPQMTVRVVVVFLWGVVLVRLGDRRLLGKNAGFDVLLVVILGSVLSRAVNGRSPFFPTLGVSAVLVFLHHLLAWLTSRSDRLSRWIKGSPRLLIVDGEIQTEALKRSYFTTEDLEENLRLHGNVSGAQQVREARLERNGSVSVVRNSE